MMFVCVYEFGGLLVCQLIWGRGAAGEGNRASEVERGRGPTGEADAGELGGETGRMDGKREEEYAKEKSGYQK